MERHIIISIVDTLYLVGNRNHINQTLNISDNNASSNYATLQFYRCTLIYMCKIHIDFFRLSCDIITPTITLLVSIQSDASCNKIQCGERVNTQTSIMY